MAPAARRCRCVACKAGEGREVARAGRCWAVVEVPVSRYAVVFTCSIPLGLVGLRHDALKRTSCRWRRRWRSQSRRGGRRARASRSQVSTSHLHSWAGIEAGMRCCHGLQVAPQLLHQHPAGSGHRSASTVISHNPCRCPQARAMSCRGGRRRTLCLWSSRSRTPCSRGTATTWWPRCGYPSGGIAGFGWRVCLQLGGRASVRQVERPVGQSACAVSAPSVLLLLAVLMCAKFVLVGSCSCLLRIFAAAGHDAWPSQLINSLRFRSPPTGCGAARRWAAAPWTCHPWTTACCACRSKRWCGRGTSGWWPTKVGSTCAQLPCQCRLVPLLFPCQRRFSAILCPACISPSPAVQTPPTLA